MMIRQSFENYYRNQHTIPAHTHTHKLLVSFSIVILFRAFEGIKRFSFFFSSFLPTIRELNWKYSNCFRYPRFPFSSISCHSFLSPICLHRIVFVVPRSICKLSLCEIMRSVPYLSIFVFIAKKFVGHKNERTDSKPEYNSWVRFRQANNKHDIHKNQSSLKQNICPHPLNYGMCCPYLCYCSM